MEDAPEETVGQQVTRLRTRFGLSLKDLAASLEMGEEALFQLERWPSHVSSRETIVRLATRFQELGASEADLSPFRAELSKLDRAERAAKSDEWVQKPGIKLIVLGVAMTLGAPLAATFATWNLSSGGYSAFQRELVEDAGLPLMRWAFFLGPICLGMGIVTWAIARVRPRRE
jgi:hypothetical protein